MKYVLVAVAALIVAILSGGYYVFMRACHRGKTIDWEDPDQVGKNGYAPHADRISRAIQWVRQQKTEDVWLDSRDGLRLHGVWIPSEQAKATVILFHGYHSTPMCDFSMILPFYHSLGLNLLLADQRAHGRSEGKYITFGIREHQDALSWIDYHNEHFGSIPVYLGGMSMGATTVLMAAGRKMPENVKGISADCGFTDPYEILAQVMHSMHVPVFPLLHAAGIFTRLFAGFGLREYSTIRAMETCRLPILLIHGLSDDFVPCEMSRRAYRACKTEKKLLLAEGAGHGTSFLFDQARIQSALENFFMDHLQD